MCTMEIKLKITPRCRSVPDQSQLSEQEPAQITVHQLRIVAGVGNALNISATGLPVTRAWPCAALSSQANGITITRVTQASQKPDPCVSTEPDQTRSQEGRRGPVIVKSSVFSQQSSDPPDWLSTTSCQVRLVQEFQR